MRAALFESNLGSRPFSTRRRYHESEARRNFGIAIGRAPVLFWRATEIETQ
jgi:hypothetical protein